MVGHTVGWASYHDQWLSEGFAEFSAGLFVQNAFGPGWHKDWIEFWDRLRQRVLEKNNFGIAPNDAGPLWMGKRLISPHTLNAYQNVTYPKGAYVLEMLRSLMYSPEDKDKEFIAMMHDFVDTYRDRPACTESFKAIAEKHMTKTMDLKGDHKLNWFFDEWVYGTQVPRYHFDYQVTPADGGKVETSYDDHAERRRRSLRDAGSGLRRFRQGVDPHRADWRRRQRHSLDRRDIACNSEESRSERLQRNSGKIGDIAQSADIGMGLAIGADCGEVAETIEDSIHLRTSRQCGAHGHLAYTDQFFSPFEVVIGESGYVGFHHKIGSGSPNAGHGVLRDGEGLSDDVEQMARRSAVSPGAFEMHG